MAKLEGVHEAAAAADWQVVFVHGLNLTGSADHYRATWMHRPDDEATLWPCWLGQDTGLGCWLANYDAHAFKLTGDAMDLTDQGTALLMALATTAAVKDRPLVLVGHSLGGLVIKQALVHAGVTSSDARLQAVLQQVKAVVFVASPHQGAQLARLAKAARRLAGSNPQLGSMAGNDVHLGTLNKQFLNLQQRHQWAVRVFGEMHPMRLHLPGLGWRLPWGSFFVVDRNSSDPAVPGCDLLPVPADHVQIARPAARDDEPYRTVLDMLRGLVPACAGSVAGSLPWPELPALNNALSPAATTTLRQWAAQPVTNTQSWALHRYATLRLGRLGGDESAGHESFVNLQLQPVHRASPGAGGADGPGLEAAQPQSFESIDALLASDTTGRSLWLLKGTPGAGKSTLLHDLELRRLHTAIEHWQMRKPGLPELCLRLSLAEFDASSTALNLAQVLPRRWAEQCVPGSAAAEPPMEPPVHSTVNWAALAQVARLRPLVDGLNEIRLHPLVDPQAAPHTAQTGDAQRRFVDALHQWATQQVAAGNAAPVLTVRQLNYVTFLNNATLAPVCVVDVQGWTLQQIEDYCDRRFPGRSNPLWKAVQALPDSAPERQRSALLQLFANPFNLAAQCWLFGQDGGSLAPNRGVLLGRIALLRLRNEVTARKPEVTAPGLLQLPADEEAIARLVEQTPPGALHELPLRGRLLQQLENLARALHQRAQGGWGRLVPNDPLLQTVGTHLTAALQAASALKLASQHANGDWQFDHQLWQEYFAACQVARAVAAVASGEAEAAVDDPAALDQALPPVDAVAPPPLQPVPADAWELPSPEPSPWDQCLQLAVQMAAAPAAHRLLRRLLQNNLALAGRAAAGRRQDLPAGLLADLRAALLARSTNGEADLRKRIEAGLLLGILGDNIRYREGAGVGGVRYLVPRHDLWLEVPPGSQQVGGLADYKDSANVVPVAIAAGTRLAFAPVTQAEFACFVQAGGYGRLDDKSPPPWWEGQAALDWWQGKTTNVGLADAWRQMRAGWHNPGRGPSWVARTWLTALRTEQIEQQYAPIMAMNDENFKTFVAEQTAAKKHREPAFLHDGNFNNPLQPAVGISLWEAQAYCRWLAHHSGQPVRLPTEAEWEVAARGGGQRGVHWPCDDAAGPAAAGAANHLGSRVRRTTPVACFAGGTTPEGWVDLCGQVWEWTSSAWSGDGIDADKVHAALSAADNAERVVRGGGWNSPAEDCRAAIRGRDRPSVRVSLLGFRLLVCPIQSPEP